MSVFKHVTAKFYVDIPASQMGRLRDAAKVKITERLFKHDPDLQGIVLAYQKVRPLSPFVSFYADHPFCHIQMEGEFLVFKPFVGARLPAVVTFLTASAVCLQICDFFPAFIEFEELKSVWHFSGDVWVKGEDSFGKGDTVIVEVKETRPATEGMALEVRILRKADKIPGIRAATQDERLF
jgi:hypothetical protein